MARRTAKQIAASRRNLVKARAKRKAGRRTYNKGIAYHTKTERTLIGRRHVTNAYKRGQLVGFAESYSPHRKKKAELVNIYVSKSHRGSNVSKNLINHQLRHTKGMAVTVTGHRTVGGNKLVNRSGALKYTVVKPHAATISSKEITANMDSDWAYRAESHARSYRKRQVKSAARARKTKRRG